MEEIAPFRGKSYYKNEGFYYKKTRTLPSGTVLYCCHDGRCHGRVDAVGGRLVVKAPHNHLPEPWVEDRNAMFEALKRRASAEATALRTIYDEEAGRHAVGAGHLLFESVRSSMRMWRRSMQPGLPGTLREYAVELLNRPREGLVVLGSVGAGGASAVVLAMVNYGPCLRAAEVILADGTFDVVPAEPEAYQLLTLHCIVNGRYFHPVVALMTRRTRVLYDAVLGLVWRAAERPQPQHLLSDYEHALHAALTNISPASTISGCYFHYAQALVRRARTMRIGVRRGSPGSKMVALYMGLALLPAGLVPAALAELPAAAEETEAQFDERFDDYYRAYWMARITPERFSVEGALYRTTNVAESYHAQLNAALRRRPNIWEFTEKMRQKFIISAGRYNWDRPGVGNLPGARNFARQLVRCAEHRDILMRFHAGQMPLRQCLLRLSGLFDVEEDRLVNDDIGAEVEIADLVLPDPGLHAIDLEPPAEVEPPAALALLAAQVPVPGPAIQVPAPAPEAEIPAPAPDVQIPPAPDADDDPLPQDICRICRDRRWDSNFNPCGHVICNLCADQIARTELYLSCPYCRSVVISLIRIYVP